MFSSVQLLSRALRLATPWTAAHQASLSITNSWNLLKTCIQISQEEGQVDWYSLKFFKNFPQFGEGEGGMF